jgi:hypothetical protein
MSEKKKIRLSNSALDCYTRCPKSYYFRYIENLKADITSTPLLYGIAIDGALNYILECMRDKKEYSVDEAKRIFVESMESWSHQNRLDFFKSEVPEELKDSYDEGCPDTQEAVWDLIVKRGLSSIDVYVKEIVPQIDEVISIQDKQVITNADGHEFVFVLDFIAKMKDGRTVLMDNKTSSARYTKNSVKDSQQLSLYLDQFPEITHAGYAVLIKNPAKERGVTYQLIIDEIPEETTEASYKKLDDTLNKIAAGEFPCYPKGCGAFGKRCQYEAACKYGDYTGLIPAYEKKKEENDSA